MLIYEEIYTAGKKITLPPAVTNLTSVTSIIFFCNQSSFCHQVDVAGKNCALLKKPETKTKTCNIHCTLRSDNIDNDNDGGDSSDDGRESSDDGEDSNVASGKKKWLLTAIC